MQEEYNIYGKYGCWWEGGTGVSPEGNQCGECYPQWEDRCPHLKKYKETEKMTAIIADCGICIYHGDVCEKEEEVSDELALCIARKLYEQGYRKQSEGEWLYSEIYCTYICSECEECAPVDDFRDPRLTDFCPNCGSKMKGE